MKGKRSGLLSLLLCLSCQTSPPRDPLEMQTQIQGQPVLYTFSDPLSGQPPKGFSFPRSGGGAMGQWTLAPDAAAPSPPQVLLQQNADPSPDRYLLAVANQPSLQNLRLSVKCKALSGRVDQALGLAFRYRDADNYYLTRANALEGNIRLYRVHQGNRQQLASWKGQVTPRTWHDYRVDVFNARIEVYWNGQRVLSAQDSTFPDADRVGVWTKADSVSTFDDLSVIGLAPKS